MAFGNHIGAVLREESVTLIKTPKLFSAGGQNRETDLPESLFIPLYGSLILEVDMSSCHQLCGFPTHLPETLEKARDNCLVLGGTSLKPIIALGDRTIVTLEEAQDAWEKPLARVFPPLSPEAETAAQENLPQWALNISAQTGKANQNTGSSLTLMTKGAKPLVVLPVFPGTNCEYDMARAFRLSGGETRIVVLRNRTPQELSESLAELRSSIDSAQILAFSGGFSAGDEPDGSGKFIANVIREASIADSIMDLLDQRKGLILGICNGFQALIKVGLVPFGKILSPSADMPTLTYNTLGRHISRFAATRMTSSLSPWAQGRGLEPGKVHQVPLSHGEGRVIIEESLAKKLFAQGQVFTQYVDADSTPTMAEPANPNGSMYAIEGLTDPSGRVLGKMGHSERPIDLGPDGRSNILYRNIPGDTCQNIFAAGVRYFNERT
jgi:phosphoribosylformylglycinamidine synthase